MRENQKKRIKRHRRIRKKIVGTEKRPRLCVYRGLANLHVQLIDDLSAKTLLSVSTQDKDLKKKLGYGGNIKAARLLGEVLAKRAQEKGINEVVFDRGGFLYHGRIKALAETAREHNLKF
ncbi:MAG: 50S ribosomal protein L18 [Candidatus Omnitrophica bacterium]|nr:50S ribosomal protein L18 [Candidatus Omnitrophota bacterium]